jgi:hypothetical protein
MMYQVLNDAGDALDAHVEFDGNDLIFHSRGGKRGQPGARNLDYGPALRLLLQRLENNGLRVTGAWIDSDQVLHTALSERTILDGSDLSLPSSQKFRTMSRRMQSYGRPEGAPYGGSRVKKIRVRLSESQATDNLVAVLGLVKISRERLHVNPSSPPVPLTKITAEEIWEAVQRLEKNPTRGSGEEHSDFELIAGDGMRLSTNAVLVTAAQIAVGAQFTTAKLEGDALDHYHDLLGAAGFEVIPRGEQPSSTAVPISSEDREWTEGRPKLVQHLKRERAPGLARAKKMSFLRLHGKLRCERCGLVPEEVLGEFGDACIEVHHKRIGVGEMGNGDRTRLQDLECLCANCHRIVHASIREQQ